MKSLRVLIIDDNELDQESIRRWCVGHTVYTSKRLSDIDHSIRYDVVLCDMNMPAETFTSAQVIRLAKMLSRSRLLTMATANDDAEICKTKASIQECVNCQTSDMLRNLAVELRKQVAEMDRS